MLLYRERRGYAHDSCIQASGMSSSWHSTQPADFIPVGWFSGCLGRIHRESSGSLQTESEILPENSLSFLFHL